MAGWWHRKSSSHIRTWRTSCTRSNFTRAFSRIFDYETPNQPHESDEVYALLDALVPADSSLARAFDLAVLDLEALVYLPNDPSIRIGGG